ncbi:BPI fold-containing family C protein [Bienertia sinuspersici]
MRTCTCYQWKLTGIPCVHAYRCIQYKRAEPNNYVHEAYSRACYESAYDTAIKPIPGLNHWKKVDIEHPLPPLIRVMQGRPKSKKRRKEKGEDAVRHPKRTKRTTNCSNYGMLGHNKKTCKNPMATKTPKPKTGRSPNDNAWTVAD